MIHLNIQFQQLANEVMITSFNYSAVMVDAPNYRQNILVFLVLVLWCVTAAEQL